MKIYEKNVSNQECALLSLVFELRKPNLTLAKNSAGEEITKTAWWKCFMQRAFNTQVAQ